MRKRDIAWVLIIWAMGLGVGWAIATEDDLRCVNISADSPGHGFGDRLQWVAAVCKDDDGLWRWSVPVEWSELHVSARPPVEP